MGSCATTAKRKNPSLPKEETKENGQIDASQDTTKQNDQPRVSNLQVSDLEDSVNLSGPKRLVIQVKPISSSNAPIVIPSSKLKPSTLKDSKNVTAAPSKEDITV